MNGTPSQTVGPFFAVALPSPEGPQVVPPWRAGAITLHGRVLDGAGAPVGDALVETWQAPGLFGRCPTDVTGGYRFCTVKPPASGANAPYIAVLVFARGLLRPVATRVYFPADPANATDPVLSEVDPQYRDTLVAARDADGAYRFDVRLRGERETVFLDCRPR